MGDMPVHEAVAVLSSWIKGLHTERGSAAEQFYKRLGWQIIRHDHYDGIAV